MSCIKNGIQVNFSAKDIRYNQKGNILYATLLGVPTGNICLKSLGKTKEKIRIKNIEMLGKEGKNVILLKVDATEYKGWWYEGCGIYRHVWLSKTDNKSINFSMNKSNKLNNSNNVIRYFLCGIILSLCSISFSYAQTKALMPFGPVPTANQMRWQEMGFYAFVHFSLNTYTDQSWGYGNEDINLFNPKESDCRQWARICKEAGMKGIIITAKHHCGFCLWPSKYTEYSVKNAPWKNGKGDMVREMADACKEYGLKLGVYLSPWDRKSPDYGKPEYITCFRNQLTELLTNYGPIFEVWFDGANGGSGYYGGANETRTIDRTTYYDWKNTYKLIHKLQPNCVIWNDGGTGAIFVGLVPKQAMLAKQTGVC